VIATLPCTVVTHTPNVLQWCYSGVPVLLQCCYSVATVLLQDVAVVLDGDVTPERGVIATRSRTVVTHTPVTVIVTVMVLIRRSWCQ
jgi:hypothetical protein